MASERPDLGYYDIGRTPFFALQADPRFSYCLFVPPDYRESNKAYRLIVLVHGTERSAAAYRDAFADLAVERDCIILAPLFAANMTSANDLSSYKFIRYGGINYDDILFAMVAEVAAKYRLKSEKFSLYGFSGGGHFAHRMFILHPERLEAVSIGAPGLVTLLDPSKAWWAGISDLEKRFGKTLNLDAMRTVPVQMVIGDQDTETWEITLDRTSEWWVEGANDAGVTRLDRIASLKKSFEDHGIAVRLDCVSGAAHLGIAMFPSVIAFFADVLSGRA
jgi:pimeloyl-ACP methyl ester carboxylesterase